ncbi:sigma 54-interacting transcriptional regulator [Marinobacterium sediminicola]|uniref:Two-component system, NtrC family, response regulator GlrR n=1 Tax=Marinobacterium sediminicola TaxID=518898 RepID=A0ABY1RWD8_9GAMM|nr:sigma 54-interacting transcriptional regulator [Marinobacterium sediminicola]ULG70347.1 sigma 54-interacting transcriptional regulator [Marinobacterium sediminicola]SMR69661.1 two-component system, NtrC family, response regulator GlrR [Marinobacterium sediminicola]
MTSTPNILLVDDDTALLKLLEMRLQASGYEISCAESGEEALGLIRQYSFDLVLTDLRMDGMDGLTLFSRIQQEQPDLPVIIMTAHGSIPEAVEATQKGVFGFLSKPIDKQHLLDTVRAALKSSQRNLDQSWRASIISHSDRMEQILDQAQRVAASDVSVLITGPSGSGKELVAKAIHKASARGDKPFVAINCGALPEQLLESELFGHTKGAFTGAVNQHEGLFRAAQGGTLFLDEIGDMPITLQVKLLRALQERTIRPVGSTQSVPIDVRIISATHRNLESAMLSQEFREDLYYRLNVVNLELPPLRERPEDIPLLARHFLSQAAQRHNRKVRGISPGALHLLAQAAWPGNVRQLENVMEQVVALSPSPIIPEGLVSKALTNQERVIPSFNEARADFERRYLIKVLQITEGNVTHAARIAQRNRTDFYKLLNKHDLEAAEFKASAKAALAAQQEALKQVDKKRKAG